MKFSYFLYTCKLEIYIYSPILNSHPVTKHELLLSKKKKVRKSRDEYLTSNSPPFLRGKIFGGNLLVIFELLTQP